MSVINNEEVIISVRRFMNNLLAIGMTVEDMPLLFKRMKDAVEDILDVPNYNQTS